MADSPRLLLSVIELGGYPSFNALYRRLGYEVVTEWTARRAMAVLRTSPPAVVVADFFHQREFRDRVSNLESLLASLQRTPQTRVIVIYLREDQEYLDRVRARFRIDAALALPVTPEIMAAALATAA